MMNLENYQQDGGHFADIRSANVAEHIYNIRHLNKKTYLDKERAWHEHNLC